jgi:hypothetical protein
LCFTPDACWRGSTSPKAKGASGDERHQVRSARETAGTEITRFNALRHGVLSRYTVLPSEISDEYLAVMEGATTTHGYDWADDRVY